MTRSAWCLRCVNLCADRLSRPIARSVVVQVVLRRTRRWCWRPSRILHAVLWIASGEITSIVVTGVLFLCLYLMGWAVAKSKSDNGLARLAAALDEAEVWRGQSLPLGAVGEATIHGRLGGRRVRIEYAFDNQGGRTIKLSVEVPDPCAGQLRLERSTTFTRFAQFMHARPAVDTGDARLDAKYLLNGEADALRELFATPGLEAALDASLDAHSLIELDHGWLTASRASGVVFERDPLPDLRHLITLARLFERRTVQAKALGDELHFALVDVRGDLRCPYCHDGIDLDALALATCPQCDTVHHAACLDEAGGCVVFGCRGRRPRAERER